MTEGSAPSLFGFVQFDLGGALTVSDGRYVVRGDGDDAVLVLETHGAPAPPRRRRRKPHGSVPDAPPRALPLARVTVVRSTHPFATEDDAASWLDGVVADEAAIDDLVARGLALLNRALHVNAVASGDPHPQSFTPARAVAVRIGFGSGEEVADGNFASAREVDVRGGVSPRRQREQALRPQERLAMVLGGREGLDACETLLLRARADLDAGRIREAALQLRIGLEALLVELPRTVDDPAHDEDVVTLESRRREAADVANAALRGNLEATQLNTVRELLQLCERVLRRRRVLEG